MLHVLTDLVLVLVLFEDFSLQVDLQLPMDKLHAYSPSLVEQNFYQRIDVNMYL